jgi:hypothetical protein
MDDRGDPLASPPATGGVGESAMWALISAAIFLYVGFGLGLVGTSGDKLYDGSVLAFVWMARVVGVALVLVAILLFTGMPGAGFINLTASILATVGCAATGAVWMLHGDMQGFLLLIFAAVNGSAARRAWQDWQSRRG